MLARDNPQSGRHVSTNITRTQEFAYQAPETSARRAYPNLIYLNEVDRGGHFAAWEHPEFLSAELREGSGRCAN
jgi:hypothetical protein